MTATGYHTIVQLLTHNLRLITDSQVAKLRGVPVKIARQGLRREEQSGYIKLDDVHLHPPLPLDVPLVEWNPESESMATDWDAIAWKAQSRWNMPPVRALVASATKKGQQLTGGPLGGRPLRLLEISHDATLTEVFLRQPLETRRHWIPEDALTEFGTGEKRPDAVLRLDDQDIFVELAGKAYSAEKLRSIHKSFASRGCQYRIY